MLCVCFFDSYCSGQTLYTYVRTNVREKFNMNKTILIAQQIAQVGLCFVTQIQMYVQDLKLRVIL